MLNIIKFLKKGYLGKIILFFLLMFGMLAGKVFLGYAEDMKEYKVETFAIEIHNEGHTLQEGKWYSFSIEALNSEGKRVEDFDSTLLIFSEEDEHLDFLDIIDDNTLQFGKEIKGYMYFENGMKFSKGGLIDLWVYDLEDTEDKTSGAIHVEVIETEQSKIERIKKIEVREDQKIILSEKTKGGLKESVDEIIAAISKHTYEEQIKKYRGILNKLISLVGDENDERKQGYLIDVGNLFFVEKQKLLGEKDKNNN